MLSFEEFKKSPRCKQLTLPDEEQPQDARDWRVLEKADQEKQYQQYCQMFEPKEIVDHHVTLPVTQQLTGLRNNGKSRAEYMRNYRKRPKYCPHCKKQL